MPRKNLYFWNELWRNQKGYQICHAFLFHQRVQEIKQAIDRLSPAECYNIAMWILESRESGDHVAEPAPAYNTALENRHLSVEDYLDFELGTSTRHEYIAGEISAMTGVSAVHNLIMG